MSQKTKEVITLDRKIVLSNGKAANIYDALTDYELGMLFGSDIIYLFQALIDTGIVWELDRIYQEKATQFLSRGFCVASL